MPGAFAARRKYDIHTGVDLYVPQNTKVYAGESGTVVAVEEFTGPGVETPWWNQTWAVLIEGNSGIVVYGEIKPDPNIEVGRVIYFGDKIGKVIPVLKTDKGKPMSMLHVELLERGQTASAPVWLDEKPVGLLDPTELLTRWKNDKENKNILL